MSLRFDRHRFRVVAAFVLLFVLYQSAEGIGGRLLNSVPVQSALMLAAFAALWPLAWWIGRRGLGVYGLDGGAAALRSLLTGLMLTHLGKGAAIAAAVALGLATATRIEGGDTAGAAALAFVATTAMMTFVPSLVEDVLTRGFLFRTFDLTWSGPVFVLVSAALFTANHIYRFDWGVAEQARLFCCGLAYGAATWRFRTLWAGVGLHWGYNLANEIWGRWSPLAVQADDAGRLVTAGLHLAIFAIVVVWPPQHRHAAAA